MKRILLVAIIAAFVATACENIVNHDVIIDNPHFADLDVTVGEEEYHIHGYDDVSVELSHGEHVVKAINEDGETVFDGTIEVTADGIMNPTAFTYVVWNDLYCDAADYERLAATALDLQEVVMVNGNEYNDVDFTVYEGDLFIEDHWDYGVDVMWPDTITVSEGGYSAREKMYRVDMLEEEWGYWGDYDLGDYTEEDINALLDSIAGTIEEEEIVE